MALVVSVAVQLMAIGLFAIGIAEFLSLLKGALVLRRIARAGTHNYTAVLLKSPLVPPVSTIAVPPDASPESIRFARRLLELHFGRNEVVVVLDGPPESEMAVWHEEFHLCPSARTVRGNLPTAPVRGVYESKDPIRIVVIEKDKGGPVDAWNAAVNACSSPVIGFLDPASDFQPDILLRLIQPMLESTDEIIAVCSGVPAPIGMGLTARFGALQSLRDWMTRGAAFRIATRLFRFPARLPSSAVVPSSKPVDLRLDSWSFSCASTALRLRRENRTTSFLFPNPSPRRERPSRAPTSTSRYAGTSRKSPAPSSAAFPWPDRSDGGCYAACSTRARCGLGWKLWLISWRLPAWCSVG